MRVRFGDLVSGCHGCGLIDCLESLNVVKRL